MNKFLQLLVLTLLIASCAGFLGEEPAGWDQQATPEAVRIKALLMEASDLEGSAIAVEYQQGVVKLGGFVATEKQRSRAGDIAREQESVAEVINNIEVK